LRCCTQTACAAENENNRIKEILGMMPRSSLRLQNKLDLRPVSSPNTQSRKTLQQAIADVNAIMNR
jgi:hypothetical protein